ncbi:uncharacterized protein LOC130630135 [Hydractinia symbiolongicarpus]|uniref:uncharacterized protein LOC130630135 n=1 Tax=Hydractinia symbiolongicarpus TaxID=13093 RepID=UPI00254EC9A4|nr:uncharacterized protein LOC130630135 [Hydractinia symbiolongicarpus]
MASYVILTPTNDDSLLINDLVLALLPGEEKIYYSAYDVVCDDEEERNQYPVEFLNSITPSGLCNGTRLIVRRLHDNCIDAEVLTGNAIGDRVLIPRVQLAPSDTEQEHLKMLKLALFPPSDALMGNVIPKMWFIAKF